jgi:hypothetical protein
MTDAIRHLGHAALSAGAIKKSGTVGRLTGAIYREGGQAIPMTGATKTRAGYTIDRCNKEIGQAIPLRRAIKKSGMLHCLKGAIKKSAKLCH